LRSVLAIRAGQGFGGGDWIVVGTCSVLSVLGVDVSWDNMLVAVGEMCVTGLSIP
jgi:hypothetical protein